MKSFAPVEAIRRRSLSTGSKILSVINGRIMSDVYDKLYIPKPEIIKLKLLNFLAITNEKFY